MTVPKRKLLLIACSNRKRPDAGLLPAIQRYDGVSYRVIRKAQRKGRFSQNVDLKILSAEFGLIDGATPIPYYDRRMDKQRAEELMPQVHRELRVCLAQTRYSEIYVDVGKDYLVALETFAFPEARLVLAKGRIGVRLSKLKQWLHR